MEIIEIAVDDLKPYEKNPRNNEASVKFVANSIKEFGFKVPVVVSPDNTIICGHTRCKAAKQLGMDKVPCIVANDLDDARIKAYRLADNKVGEYSEWDLGLLGEELKELEGMFEVDMADFGFLDTDLLSDDGPTGDDDDFDPEKAVEDIVDPITQPGDLWLLGRHRLICGDSCDEATIKRLCGDALIDLYLTDPPYNVAYKGATDKKLTIENDDMDSASFLAFLTDAYAAADSVLKPGCAFYIWHASCKVGNFYQAMLNIPGWMPKQYLLWVKNSFTLGRQDYQWKHEPCWYGWKEGAAHYFIDDRKQSTVLEFDKPKRNGEHPCLSPDTLVMTIEGYRRIDSIRKGDKVLSADGKFHNVEYISRHRYIESIYKITASGSNLHDFATHNHPYLVLRRKKSKKGDKIEIGFVNAEFLKVGDYLMTPQLEMGEKAPLSELDAFCYGLWLAQGSIRKAGHGSSSYPVFSLDAKKTRLQDKLKMWSGTRKFSVYPNHGNGVTAMIFDSAKAKRCIELCGKYAGKKKIAEEVFTWNSELRKAFFEGYMAGDGCLISTRGHRHSKSISIALSSQMKFLAESIGYKVSFYHREAPQGKGIGNRKFIHTNDFYSLDYRIEKNNISMKPFIYNGIKYWLRRLDKVEALPYDGDVINLSVEGCHTFQTACSMTHNTMKPVELFEKLVENSSRPGENVLDSFGGSGTTMVACEKLGRKAFLCELDPKYADVIVKRFVNLKGADSVFLLKPDGTKVPYSEIAK